MWVLADSDPSHEIHKYPTKQHLTRRARLSHSHPRNTVMTPRATSHHITNKTPSPRLWTQKHPETLGLGIRHHFRPRTGPLWRRTARNEWSAENGEIPPYLLLIVSIGRFPQRRLLMLSLEAALLRLTVGWYRTDPVPLLSAVVFSLFSGVQTAEVPHDERLDQRNRQRGDQRWPRPASQLTGAQPPYIFTLKRRGASAVRRRSALRLSVARKREMEGEREGEKGGWQELRWRGEREREREMRGDEIWSANPRGDTGKLQRGSSTKCSSFHFGKLFKKKRISKHLIW